MIWAILLLVAMFIGAFLMWLLASIYDESKRVNERDYKVIRLRLKGLSDFYCPNCGELLDSEDPGDDCIEQYYCDCGFYTTK